MCTIAGYVGSRPAAPILIDMLRKEQFFDGGRSTGIATVHNGRLYTAKVTGDLDTLLRETDALSLPGCVGIIHSRTNDNLVEHAHPFTSHDGRLALVLNGTSRGVNTPEFWAEMNRVMGSFFDRGLNIKSMYDNLTSENPKMVLPNGRNYAFTETYALFMGDRVKDSPKDTLARGLAHAAKDALDTLPADIVTLSVHADLPDTVTAGVVTRPMVVCVGDGEAYMATSALALPEDMQTRPLISLPPTSVSQITPDGVKIVSTSLKNARVEQIDHRIAAQSYLRTEQALLGQKDDPKSVYDMPDLSDLWSAPASDCKFAAEEGFLKPSAALRYETLWALHRQGRLHQTIGERNGFPITKFWVE